MKDIDLKREIDRFEDETVLKKAVLESFEKDIEAFDAIGEMEPDIEFKKKMDQAFHRGIKQATKNIRATSKSHRMLKRISFAVAVLLIILSPSGLYVNASSRETIVNFLIRNFSQFSEIKYDANNNVCRPLGWDLTYYPLVVPQSFYYDEISLSDKSNTIWYKTSSGKTFSFSVFSLSSYFGIDTEKMKEEEVKIGSHSATLYLSEDGITNELAIYLPTGFLLLSGNLTEKELLEIGQNINGL